MKLRRAYARAALAAVVLLTVGVPGAGAHDTSWRTRVTINYGGGTFYGKVRSRHADCVPDRRVRVYHKIDGPDFLVGSDTTNGSGDWEVAFNAPPGYTFYAKVRPDDLDPSSDVHECRSARSDTITV